MAPFSTVYTDPVTDPFYSATTPYELPVGDGTNVTYYYSGPYVGVIACTDQHQLCSPTTDECTSLTTASHVIEELGEPGDNLHFNKAQLVTGIHLTSYMSRLTTYASVDSLGANALRASETVDNNFQIGLPSTQWMVEVSSWFGVSMAKLQQQVVQYATGVGGTAEIFSLAKELNLCIFLWG